MSVPNCMAIYIIAVEVFQSRLKLWAWSATIWRAMLWKTQTAAKQTHLKETPLLFLFSACSQYGKKKKKKTAGDIIWRYAGGEAVPPDDLGRKGQKVHRPFLKGNNTCYLHVMRSGEKIGISWTARIQTNLASSKWIPLINIYVRSAWIQRFDLAMLLYWHKTAEDK